MQRVRRREGQQAVLTWALLLLLPPARPLTAAPGAPGGRREQWPKVSMWRAVHELCSGALDLAEHDCKKGYWAHLGDPSPAPCTSAFGKVPVVRAMDEEGRLLQFASLRDFFEWRTDLEKKTSTDRCDMLESGCRGLCCRAMLSARPCWRPVIF